MARITVVDANGAKRAVEARRFRHYVDGIAFEFAYPDDLSTFGSLAITHIKSGRKVCNVEQLKRAAYLGDKQAPKAAIDDLVASKPAGRVLLALRRAEA